WLASAGLDTLALRWPAHPTAEALIRAAGRPLVGPSANRSGRLSPTTAAHAAAELGQTAAMVLDGGPCRLGLESTVVALGGTPVLLRLGALDAEAVEAETGPLAEPALSAGTAPRPSPGMLLRHYAPDSPLRMDAASARPGEALLGFGAVEGDLNLSPSADLVEAAANLFAMLRRLDGGSGIAVAPIPERGLGRAINDRLRRAARG
ncbi:MAG: Sua5/YciO/YrdC/YwlC family protein, partial [Alphaproteobacteria bacterium]|nr:Sua5/YciO/YrdC/YwlC family protein [Alphaproteobacteria bacterium]